MMETFKIEINGVRSNVNAQGYHSNHYVLKLPRNIEKLVFHCSASIASLVQISHSTVRPELSRPCQHAIFLFNQEGDLFHKITDGIQSPFGVTLDARGRIILTNSHRLLIF